MEFQHYPKAMYSGSDCITVDNADEEAAAAKNGWKTAAQHHGYNAAGGMDANKEPEAMSLKEQALQQAKKK